MAWPNFSRKESTTALGQKAEALAVDWLKKKGYVVLERNVRFRFGEIDIVAWDGPILVFVEVRQRSNQAFGKPHETVTKKKQERLVRAAKAYLARNKGRPPACRFDVVSILGSLDAHTISLIQNAFTLNDQQRHPPWREF